MSCLLNLEPPKEIVEDDFKCANDNVSEHADVQAARRGFTECFVVLQDFSFIHEYDVKAKKHNEDVQVVMDQYFKDKKHSLLQPTKNKSNIYLYIMVQCFFFCIKL